MCGRPGGVLYRLLLWTVVCAQQQTKKNRDFSLCHTSRQDTLSPLGPSYVFWLTSRCLFLFLSVKEYVIYLIFINNKCLCCCDMKKKKSHKVNIAMVVPKWINVYPHLFLSLLKKRFFFFLNNQMRNVETQWRDSSFIEASTCCTFLIFVFASFGGKLCDVSNFLKQSWAYRNIFKQKKTYRFDRLRFLPRQRETARAVERNKKWAFLFCFFFYIFLVYETALWRMRVHHLEKFNVNPSPSVPLTGSLPPPYRKIKCPLTFYRSYLFFFFF